MKLQDFDYHLPERLIAQHAPADRTSSRLMVIDRDSPEPVVTHAVFRDLPRYLDRENILVVNRSRVVPARMLVKRRTGGNVELLFIRQLEKSEFEAWVRPLGRMKPDEILVSNDEKYQFRFLRKMGEREGLIRLEEPQCTNMFTLLDAIEAFGHVPLPPYIHRPDEPGDHDRYQTVYAEEKGSVAAPTAGLHFDKALLERLVEAGVTVAPLVLHVGPGTFSPLEKDEVEENELQYESFLIPTSTINTIRGAREHGRRIVAVGTTVCRALESAAILGWFDVEPPEHGRLTTTSLFIYPGYEFQVVDSLITNFHLPQSSLLMLVSAFLGREQTLSCYQTAVNEEYRFYSYGDAMLIR
jgi:S-adenosylmethionine:tRNA ribosyltransferase-isomerase